MRRARYAAPYLVWMGLFIVVPLVIVLFYGLTAQGEGGLTFSVENLAKAFKPEYLGVLGRSVWMAGVATLICLIIGYPVAMILSSRHFKRGSIVLMLMVIPMWMNFLLRTYAWMSLLEDNGLINNMLAAVGLPRIHMINTAGAVVLGMVYNYIPYMILPIYSVLTKIDNSVIEAAQDLGANNRNVFLKVVLPMSMPGVISGVTMVFVPAVSTFIISKMLGGGGNLLIGDLIDMQFLGSAYNPNLGSAISLVLMVIILICMGIMNQFDDGENVGGGMIL